ncbi:MAG: alanine racemase [Clostridiaceae bacterium]|nr:alanine racemase [Clostridiaceae bacterium]
MKYLLVETDKIISNIQTIREKAEGSELIAVLKANAYGLGLKEIYPVLRQCAVRKLAVTEPDDAITLRNLGADEEEILILRSTACPEDIEKILTACATATVGSYDAAVALNGMAENKGVSCDVHIKIDTGMGRYGFEPSELERITSVFSYMSNLTVTGMFTHFPCAFSNAIKTKSQHEKFISVAENVRKAGFDPGMLHDCNSAALFTCPIDRLDAVRIGSAIGGRMTAKGSFGLKKTGVLCSEIAEIRWLPKGHGVGYGSAYVTKKPTKIGIIPVGTADGFMVEKERDSFRLRDCLRYALSDLSKLFRKKRKYVTVCGRKARIVGHVGTAHTTVDLSDIECAVGSPVQMEVSPMFVPESVERRYK